MIGIKSNNVNKYLVGMDVYSSGDVIDLLPRNFEAINIHTSPLFGEITTINGTTVLYNAGLGKGFPLCPEGALEMCYDLIEVH